MKSLAPALLVAEMPFGHFGFNPGSRMTVAKLPDGGLWVHSPIGLTEALHREVETLGEVSCLVSPSPMHYLHLKEWAEAFPKAKVWAAPSLQKVPGLSALEILSDAAPPAWAGELEQFVFQGSRLYKEVVFFHAASRTLILTDLAFNIPRNCDFTTQLWARLLGVYGHLGPSLSFKLSIRNPKAMRASLHKMFSWDFERVIVSHGTICETGGKARLQKAFGI